MGLHCRIFEFFVDHARKSKKRPCLTNGWQAFYPSQASNSAGALKLISIQALHAHPISEKSALPLPHISPHFQSVTGHLFLFRCQRHTAHLLFIFLGVIQVDSVHRFGEVEWPHTQSFQLLQVHDFCSCVHSNLVVYTTQKENQINSEADFVAFLGRRSTSSISNKPITNKPVIDHTAKDIFMVYFEIHKNTHTHTHGPHKRTCACTCV